MDKEEHPFVKSLKSIMEEIEKLHSNPPKPLTYLLPIKNIERKFEKFSEATTPKPALSDTYTCTGRLKFYADGNMFVYLEIADNENKQLAWPVRATWKVELIDENDYSKNRSTFVLGEATCIFNKPKQGFVSHPNDWISVSLQKMKCSGLISKDNSVTIRWSVVTEPVLRDVYLQKFSELLNNAKNYYDLFHGNAIQKLNDDMEAVHKNSEKHKERILKLETLLPSITGKLNDIDRNVKFLISRMDSN